MKPFLPDETPARSIRCNPEMFVVHASARRSSTPTEALITNKEFRRSATMDGSRGFPTHG